MKNRSRLDITAEILNVANDGTLKTKIMYLAYLSFDQLEEYLALLTHNGLLEYDAKKRKYKTTSKGHDFLAKYSKVKI
jgi:predicted transcriptional regulator